MRARKLAITLLLAMGLAASGNLWAQSRMELSPYVGAGVGQSDFDIDGNDFGIASGVDDDTDTAWRVFAGLRMHQYFGVELGYIDFGETTGTLGARAEATGVDLVGVGFLPLWQSGAHGFDLFGKVGGYWWDGDVSDTGLNASLDGGDDFDWTAGVGVQYTFSGFQTSGSLGVRAEWQRYNDVFGETDTDVVMGSVLWQF